MSLGALTFVLTRPPWLRVCGAAAVAASLAGWSLAERPLLLIAGEGALVGLRTPEGRALSKAKGAGFVAASWLEDDGDLVDQEAAFARGAFTGTRGQVRADLGPVTLWHLTGKTSARRAEAVCTPGAIVVIDGYWQGGSPACRLFDAQLLDRSGAVALLDTGEGIATVLSARDLAGRRLWNDRGTRARRLGN
jgi:competence protein ComEC